MRRQRGLTLGGLTLLGIIVVLVAIFTIKVVPSIIEYYTIMEDAKAVAEDPANRNASNLRIRQSFDRHAEIDSVTSIGGRDLVIRRDGNRIVLSFDYTKKIPITANVSLLIDFEGNTANGATF